MEHSLNCVCSDLNERGFNSMSFEPYIGNTTENNLQVSHPIKLINVENGTVESRELVSGSSTSFISNNDFNNNVYESINLTNSYLDQTDSCSLPAIRKVSLRGRRRYRRTLLRNYEQPFGQNSHGNQSYLENYEGVDSSHQRRVYLRNTNIGGVNGGNNYSCFKLNSDFDNYSKASKPSWDGGRLVKLLQGHGLNIENYEKENELILNKSWSSKITNVRNSQLSCINTNKDTNGSEVLIDKCYIQIKNINHGVSLKNISDKQELLSAKQLENFLPYTNDQSDSFRVCQRDNISTYDESPQRLMNNMGKQITLRDRSSEGDTASNKCFESTKIDRFSITSLDNQPLTRVKQSNEDSNRLAGIVDKNSLINIFENTEGKSFNCERKFNSTHSPDIEKQAVNIGNRSLVNIEELEGDQDLNLAYCSFNPFHNISQEELFVTLGDTPTSKSSYNLSTIFVPNQDS